MYKRGHTWSTDQSCETGVEVVGANACTLTGRGGSPAWITRDLAGVDARTPHARSGSLRDTLAAQSSKSLCCLPARRCQLGFRREVPRRDHGLARGTSLRGKTCNHG
jgi:hypothetical protein